MKGKGVAVKITALIMSVMLLVSFAGCAIGGKKAVKPDKDPKKVVQDKDYTKDLKKEKVVEDGQVYVQGNVVIATMIIKNDTKDSDVKKLAENYAKKLKKTYGDMKVNVQAVKEGKNLANITID